MSVIATWWLYPLLALLLCGSGKEATGPWPVV
jgi:hypothetical protein